MTRIVLLSALAIGLAMPALAQSADAPRYTVTFSDRAITDVDEAAILAQADRLDQATQTQTAMVDTDRTGGFFARIFAGNTNTE